MNGVTALAEVAKVEWSPELRRINNQFPGAIRSSRWGEIAALANSGQFEKAKELAKKGLDNPEVRRQTATGRRMRIERVALFSRVAQSRRDLRLLFDIIGTGLAAKVQRRGQDPTGIPFLNEKIDEAVIELNRGIRKIVTKSIRDSGRLGLKNSGNAMLPIFKANREAFEEDIEEVELQEAALSVGIKNTLASKDPRVKLSSKKWIGVMRRIMRVDTKSRVFDIKLSERIFELTKRTRLDLRRIISSNIAQGKPPAVIADKIKRHLSAKVISRSELGVILPPGAYRSPFKNAFRITRTEMNKAYTHASAEFAKGKRWIKGIRITVSQVHKRADVCDRLAAGPLRTPEEFQNLIPAHPHCMCYATYVLKPEFIDTEKEAA